MCQLEGCDRGGRDSAAELALAGGIDVNVGRLFQPADFGGQPLPDAQNYTPDQISVNDFVGPGVTNFTAVRVVQETRVFTGDLTLFQTLPYTANSSIANGQVAQLVERGPEKAGVGGSIPSLATILFNNLQTAKKTEN